ncbi:MAG: prepilin-type N-terminal cleavage/methylation domain-containing protein [Candidatus Gracilibacteria bacterium]|nr:prepilin-type N-terminal cleavage/methylation domain-containing protein [Candidatus Gracilibacteria bacterium]
MKKSAFTLVELIIVITILAILRTIGFMSYSSYVSDARDTARVVTIKSIQSGIDMFSTLNSNLPNPDNALTLSGGTGSYIKQGTIGKSVSSTLKLTNEVKDPKTNKEYVYSISGNGNYYQIGADLENAISYNNFTNQAYAEQTKAYVKGNYAFDPSLPSLITITGSVNTNSGIFDPNVCFVIDGGTNLVTSNSGTCTAKYKMSLKDYDSSLVGYWDMETLCSGQSCGLGNDGYPKNLASNDINILSGTTLKNHNNAIYITKTQTGNSINGQKSAFITDFDSALQTSGNIQGIEKSMTVSMLFKPNFSSNYPGSDNDIFARNFLYDYFSDKIRLALVEDKNGFYAYKSSFQQAKSLNNFNFQKNKIYYITVAQINTILGENNAKMSLYINGVFNSSNNVNTNLSSFSLTGSIFHFGSSNYTPESCGLGNTFPNIPAGCTFNGIIDDVKIYNRALSDQEIAQQAKIAGF